MVTRNILDYLNTNIHKILMFIPISVGAFFLSHDIYQQFPSILTLIVLSTSGVIIFMALLIRRLVQDD